MVNGGITRRSFSGAAPPPPPGRPADATASFVGEMLGAERKIEEDAGKLVRALEAIERDPKSAVAYYHLGILLEAIRGDEAGAETAYRKACELDPQYADAFITGRKSVRPAWMYYLLFRPPRRSARVLAVLTRGVLGLLTRTFDFRTGRTAAAASSRIVKNNQIRASTHHYMR